MLSTSELDPEVVALGLLAGLLTQSGDDLTVDTSWFANPAASLRTIGTRLDHLASLLGAVLGPAQAGAPAVFPDAQWYALPNPNTGAATPFCVVCSSGAETSGQLGLGVLSPFGVGNLTIQAFAYAPLVSYGPGGAQFITAGPSDPCQVGLYVTSSVAFTVGAVSFSGVSIDAGIFLSAAAPTFTLTFEGMHGSAQPASYHSLKDLLDPTVQSWLTEVLVQGSYWLKLYVGSSPYTVGGILTAAHFLSQDANGDYHLDLQNLSGSPAEIALNFVFAALDALAQLAIPLLELPGGGVFVEQSAGNYGVRFTTQIGLTQGASGSGQAAPAITLGLGSWLSGETAANNWVTQITGAPADPGMAFLFLRRDAQSGALSFDPRFVLSSVGLDIAGGADAALIDLGGYTLQGAEARAYLDSQAWVFGCAARLGGVGFPLGPTFSAAQQGAAGSNVVAQNLLASADPQAGSNDPGAVNPSFSATAAFIGSHPPLLEIYDAQGNQTDVIWFPIQRRLGPLNCRQVGLRIDMSGAQQSDPLLGIVFDGGVTLSVLDIELDQLALNMHLKDAANLGGYQLDLQGLAVSFSGGGVTISGGLLKTVDPDGMIAYDGEALIKLEELAISALGSYGSLPNHGGTSMFIFAILNGPLGGPPFFFVTGLAAGFGYNRALKLPAQNQVQNFPLVAGLADTSLIGGPNPSPAQVLGSLEQWVPPERGEYWLAAGLQFTTFEIINTNAVVVVEFGHDFVLSVLGTSALKQPAVGETFAYAELDIEVVFAPQQGEVKASAVLADGSYILTQQAQLSGGFAFYAWFGDNAHAGEFVLTLGGYHPAFVVPDYYPQEPRVGINWQISQQLRLTGDAYFALTPTAMMAGGGLELLYADGPLRAWLKAQADVIVYWKPFYLIAEIAIGIGVSYRVDWLFVHKTLSVEIAANFGLWGPPIGGSVHVQWYIISFTIGFGPKPAPPSTLSWQDFTGLLPSKTVAQPAAPAATAAPATVTTPAYLSITAQDGLKRSQALGDLTLWLVRAGQLQLAVGSALPASSIVLAGPSAGDTRTLAGSPVGIRRVNGGVSPSAYSSTQTVSILRLPNASVASIQACMATASPCASQPAGCDAQLVALDGWTITAVTTSLPQALWSDPATAGQDPSINMATPTVAGTTGLTIAPAPAVIASCTPQMQIDTIFQDRAVNPEREFCLPLTQTPPPAGTPPTPANSFADIGTINQPAVAQKRTALFQALQGLGFNGWTNDPLPLMAANPGQDFADEPMEGAPAA